MPPICTSPPVSRLSSAWPAIWSRARCRRRPRRSFEASRLGGYLGRPPGDSVANLTPEDIDALLETALSEDKLALARQGNDFSATLRHDGHTFRCRVFRERGSLAAAVRVILDYIPTLDELHLPPVFEALTQNRRGLILLAGPTGSGKSTTLLSLMDHINRNPCGTHLHRRGPHAVCPAQPPEPGHAARRRRGRGRATSAG